MMSPELDAPELRDRRPGRRWIGVCFCSSGASRVPIDFGWMGLQRFPQARRLSTAMGGPGRGSPPGLYVCFRRGRCACLRSARVDEGDHRSEVALCAEHASMASDAGSLFAQPGACIDVRVVLATDYAQCVARDFFFIFGLSRACRAARWDASLDCSLAVVAQDACEPRHARDAWRIRIRRWRRRRHRRAEVVWDRPVEHGAKRS